jgi:ADP-ribose pyrophosphatase
VLDSLIVHIPHAKRELLEETGYEAKKMVPLIKGPASSGLCAEIVFFFLAKGLVRKHAGGGDDTENIMVHEVPVSRAPKLLRAMEKKGRLVDPKVYAGLYLIGAS